MNFDFNDEQQAIKDAARDLLAVALPAGRGAAAGDRGGARASPTSQWDELVALGWPGIFVDEEHGGQGLGIVELVILLEELGYALAPTPLFSNAAAGLVLQAGGERRAEGALAGAAGAPASCAARWRCSATTDRREAEGDALTGAWAAVPDAGSADVLIVDDGERHWAVAEPTPTA